MENKFKPNRAAFIVSGIFKKILAIFLFVVVFFIFFQFIAPGLSVGIFLFVLFVVLSSIVFVLEFIVYKKLFYIFYDNKIIQKGGSLFTNYERELNIKNITHIKLKLPFLENKIFGTAHVDIESAGSGISEIHLCSIVNYKEIHSFIIDLMHKNGFNLNKGELVSVEKPNTLGVFFEIFKSFVYGLLILFYVIGSITNDDDVGEIVSSQGTKYIIPIIVLGVVLVFIIHIFKFLDLKRRVYKIYQNVITYKEGFLSKNYSILPFENLTDSGVTQTMVDKIFGLHDVKISCQGSKHEILFKNLSNGQAMSDKLDVLINEKRDRSILNEEEDKEQVVVQRAKQTRVADDVVEYNSDYTKELGMDYKRTVKFPLIIALSSLFILIILVFILSMFGAFSSANVFLTFISLVLSFVFGLIFLVSVLGILLGYLQYKYTKFFIKEKSVNYKYDFLNARSIEFSSDKVTGVVLSKNFIDDWFNTVSISFWSIGASSSLHFSHIKRDDEMIKSLVSKFGIKKGEEIFNLRPEFSLSEYLKSSFPTFLIFAFAIISSVGIFLFGGLPLLAGSTILLAIVFFSLYYFYKQEYYKRTKIFFYKSFIYYQKGWLFKKYYYVKYEDIKDIQTLRYPLSGEGRIKFNVAGERIIKTGKGGTRIISNHFSVDYILGIREKDELIDYVFYKRPNQDEINRISEDDNYKKIGIPNLVIKPSLKNALAPFLIIITPIDLLFLLFSLSLGVFIFTMFVIFIVIIFNILLFLPIYLSIKMTTYIMDDYRVLSKSGVIFKKQISVIYDKIDFIANSQGFLNKVFKNGNITVNTVGSSSAELSIKNIPKFLDFYKNLKSKYEDN